MHPPAETSVSSISLADATGVVAIIVATATAPARIARTVFCINISGIPSKWRLVNSHYKKGIKLIVFAL